jgi:hypothetical protein
MFMNFMDYVDDPAKYMFTPDQALRIQTAMSNSPYRKFLGTHALCNVATMPAASVFKAPISVCLSSSAITLTNQTTGIPVPSYTWNVSGGAFINPNANSQVAAINFPGPGTYTISLAADNGTLTSSTQVVTVYQTSVNISGAKPVVCEGQYITLTASGANYYTWSPPGSVSDTVSFIASGVSTYSCMAVGPGNCKTTTVVSITSMDCTGIENHSSLAGLSVSPNPASETLFFSNPSAPISSVMIRDISGRQIYQQDISSSAAQIDISSLPKGIYLVEVRSSDATKTVKLIKD